MEDYWINPEVNNVPVEISSKVSTPKQSNSHGDINWYEGKGVTS